MVLGAGRGLAAVLRALRGHGTRLTVIVSIAYQPGDGDEVQRRVTGASVEDLRRSLEALSGEERPLLRAIRRPLTIERLGRHPLGNLVIASAASAFDDYGRASEWLGQQLGIEGAVLPATTELVRWEIEPFGDTEAPSVPGDSVVRPSRLVFIDDRIDSPAAAVDAIERSEHALLAPGSLYRSVLSTAAVPDLAAALRTTAARVLWITSLERDPDQPATMTAIDHLQALRMNGVRVDAALFDPSAALRFEASELARYGVEAIPRALRSIRNPRVHDPRRLRSALGELIAVRPAGRSEDRSD
ncbi:MAG TPA: 2-phospho-L-lactate transferase CofD family protein [Solirubrobacteraceae bacterium]|nr:2-phospho-L-lactate transferase CofD family protein [Solirubrobacteraceae bacterium]